MDRGGAAKSDRPTRERAVLTDGASDRAVHAGFLVANCLRERVAFSLLPAESEAIASSAITSASLKIV